MRIVDILNYNECRNIFNEVNQFAEQSLSEYIEVIESNKFYFSDKDIFDFVWGTINFSKVEICILDSPLLQRLKYIKQLGLANTVYCNADSSRFSHTIGVVEVASRMEEVVSRKNQYDNEKFNTNEIVRFAAIFHDVGHMYFSHVSELFFSSNKNFSRSSEIIKAITTFSVETSSEVSLHELLSVMIVNSPAVKRLLLCLKGYMKSRLANEDDVDKFIDYISCLIIGVPIDKFILPYSSIINSSIDADKLDYLSRDSESTKVPIAVDIARIIQKLELVSIKDISKPKIWNDSTNDSVQYKIMAIRSSAKRVFWQLSNARSSMYESVYHHHKILTAETMFRDALEVLYSKVDDNNKNFANILKLTDDAFNDYWYNAFFSSDTGSEDFEEIDRLFKNIKRRVLYKRVASLSVQSFGSDKAAAGIFVRTVIQDDNSPKHKEFVRIINDEYKTIHKILSLDNIKCDKPIFKFISLPYESMPPMPIEDENGFCIWSSNLMKQETIEAGRHSKQEQYYLITNCIDRENVFLAFEKTLTKFGINNLNPNTATCLKLHHSELNDTRKRLLELGYYDDSLQLLKDDILLSLIDRDKIDAVLNKYQNYLGKDSSKVTRETLIVFLRQFLWLNNTKKDLCVLLDGVLTLLENATYINRETFAKEESTLINDNLSIPSYNHKYILTTGGLYDSATHLTYYFNDVNLDKKTYSIHPSLDTILETANLDKDVICFFDDGAYSGKQIVSIFQEFMGVPVEERATNEHHVAELSPENKCRLKKSKVILLYLCFNKNSNEYIKKSLSDLGIQDITIFYSNDLSQKIFDDKILFKDETTNAFVKKQLSDIGVKILESTKSVDGQYKSRWSKDRVDKSGLGYNDSQQMVVFENNVPTYCITCFWANGNVDGNNWKGLFQRTDKD